MAKSKKDIDAFQKAMLTNTRVIGKKERASKTSTIQDKSAQATTTITPKPAVKGTLNGLAVGEDLRKEIETVTAKYNIGVAEFVDIGLRMVLKLEDYWFKESDQEE